MKMNKITQMLCVAGLTMASASAFALEAWNGQEGGDTYEVIFDGGVYSNAWWVGATNCPGTAEQDQGANPWRKVRDASATEMSQYGNPTVCEIAGDGTQNNYVNYDSSRDYLAGDIVLANGMTYKTSKATPAHSFAPAENNPWVAYAPTPVWSSSTTYNQGDKVQKDGVMYEALFYTVNNDPSLAANQNPEGNNGHPWKPLGAVQSYSQDQIDNAPTLNINTLYPANSLVKYNGKNYQSAVIVQKVKPDDVTPWAVYMDWSGTKERVGTPKNPWPAQFYAPYVDFTLNMQPDLVGLAKNQNVNHFTMAFMVAKDANTCVPTWGTAYSVTNYAQYSKIKALREAGGDIMVSIGGANNAPLAAACNNVNDLAQHYYDIVENLNLQVLDFDIEGNWLADKESIQRRNAAVKLVQDRWAAEGRHIGIWYTLPVLPTGLTHEGMEVLQDAKDQGVVLTGVNVMAMDYGNIQCQSANTEGQNIHGKCATSAIDNLFAQVKGLYPEKSAAQVYAMLGTTPMIGYNDVQGEVFYLSDARLVYQQAKDYGLGMIGAWSMARDQPGVSGQVSAEHSGMTPEQAPLYAYSQIFAPITSGSAAPIATNTPPVANAGMAQQVSGTGVITLDGSASTDKDGDSLTYQWKQVSGPAVTLQNSNSAKATFSVAQPVTNAVYTFSLTVSDSEGSTTAQTSVNVIDASKPVAPSVTLESTYTVTSGESLTLTAKVTDPDTQAADLHYQWTNPAGLPVAPAQGAASNTEVINAPQVTVDTRFTVDVTVTDNTGLTDTATTTVLVKAKAAAAGYDYVYPESSEKYVAGTKVLGSDGSIYQCKPFPYSGWCGQAAWAYAPATGTNWQDAWDKQ